MRQLATIRTIKELLPIEGADEIELAIIDGWQCVVSKSDGFKVGDKCIYIEIDSVLPKRPEFEFLAQHKYRVKSIRLRGQISQGLALPVRFINKDCDVGEDVTELLGIKKYDPEAIAEEKIAATHNKKNPIIGFLYRYRAFRKLMRLVGLDKSNVPFPGWINKTDEERIQNMPNVFETLKRNRIFLKATEKIDGTSATYYLHKGIFSDKFGVCSRNLELPEGSNNFYWEIANKHNIKEMLRDIRLAARIEMGLVADSVVLQGEIVGEGIQKNKYAIKGHKLYPFTVYVDGIKIDPDNFINVFEAYTILPVPFIRNMTIPEDRELIDFANEAIGLSVVNPKIQREGLVFRNYDECVSFKAINPLFLLKNNA